MKKRFSNWLISLSIASLGLYGFTNEPVEEQKSLKSALKKHFYIGAALNTPQINEADKAGCVVLKKHFNSIVAENCMKSMVIHPEENRYDFTLSDKFVELGEKNDMFIIGHALIWHSQLSRWFCVDEKGENVSAEVLKKRMKEHISTVVGRYKGRIHGWDVVNEAIMEDGSYRKSKFYEILGEEFIPLAFQYAHEADPDVELYYNDYNEWYPGKRATVIRMIRELKKRNIRIDAIGLQGHIDMNSPTLKEYEETILGYANEGVKVMVTELDLSALPSPYNHTGADIGTNFEYQNKLNPYKDGMTKEASDAWDARMMDFFNLLMKHSEHVSRVTMWGISDATSWKNNFPVRGRTDYPLLFDRKHQPKPVVDMIIQAAEAPEELQVYLCFGQSNMEGHAKIQPEDTINIDPRFKVLRGVDCPEKNFHKGQWYTAVPPLTHCHSGVSLADFFGRKMVEKLPWNVNVGVINVSIGGCRIELFEEDSMSEYISNAPDWMKAPLNNYDNNPYARLVELAKQAIREGGIIKGILLHQGESNTGDREWPSKVAKIYNKLLKDIGYEPNSVPLLAGELLNTDQNGSCASMNEIINTLPSVITNSYVIPSVGCESAGDGLHFNTVGYSELGKRYAEKILSILNAMKD